MLQLLVVCVVFFLFSSFSFLKDYVVQTGGEESSIKFITLSSSWWLLPQIGPSMSHTQLKLFFFLFLVLLSIKIIILIIVWFFKDFFDGKETIFFIVYLLDKNDSNATNNGNLIINDFKTPLNVAPLCTKVVDLGFCGGNIKRNLILPPF